MPKKPTEPWRINHAEIHCLHLASIPRKDLFDIPEIPGIMHRIGLFDFIGNRKGLVLECTDEGNVDTAHLIIAVKGLSKRDFHNSLPYSRLTTTTKDFPVYWLRFSWKVPRKDYKGSRYRGFFGKFEWARGVKALRHV